MIVTRLTAILPIQPGTVHPKPLKTTRTHEGQDAASAWQPKDTTNEV
jgi:hypothetical protein